jgi:hypothetical protein
MGISNKIVEKIASDNAELAKTHNKIEIIRNETELVGRTIKKICDCGSSWLVSFTDGSACSIGSHYNDCAESTQPRLEDVTLAELKMLGLIDERHYKLELLKTKADERAKAAKEANDEYQALFTALIGGD